MNVDGSLIFDTEIDRKGFESDLAKIKSTASGAVSTVTAAFATIVTTASVAAANIGMSYESAFAGVKKTVDETFSISYDDINAEIRDMAKNTIPAAASSIAAVAESAGQLGIATQNVTDFSEVMINLGEATNLSAEMAASSLAKFSNITQMDASEYDNLGSAIVALGNDFATTEADIVSMSTRLASAGTTAGMAETDILGFATAMSSVGIEADAGGSSMSTFIKKMQTAVETGDGLKEFAEIADMTTEAFVQLWNTNAAGAVTAFIGNLNNIEKNGRSAVQILDEMGLTEIRLSNTLLALAGSGELMTRAIDTSNEAWQENSALMNEVEKRYSTTESIMNLTKNNLADVGITVYDKFQAPLVTAFEAATEKLQEFNNRISDGDLSDDVEEISSAFESISVSAAKIIADDALPAVIEGMGLIAEYGDDIVFLAAEIGAGFAAWKIGSVVTAATAAFQTANLQLVLLTAQSGAAAVTQTALAGGLTAAEIAAGLFTGKISMATAAQSAFNKVALLNPFGVLLAAFAALTVAAVKFSDTINEAAEEIETAAPVEAFVSMTNRATEELQKQKKAFDELTESQNQKSAADNSQINNIQRLWSELQNYVDASGNVISNNERAAEIIGLLNDNYDMNIEYIGNQIKGYSELAGSMDEYINQLRLEARIRNGQPVYDEAIKNIDELQSKYAELEDQEAFKLKAFNAADNTDVKGIFGSQLSAIRDQKAEIEAQMSEYEQVINEYEDLFSKDISESSASGAAIAAEGMANQRAAQAQAEAERLIATQEGNSEKLYAAWELAEHNYAIGAIASEEELYAKKQQLWNEYGNADLEEHWSYYEDLIGYQQDYARQAQTAYEQQLRSEWSSIEHQLQLGLISEETAYKKKLAFIQKYCPEYSEEWHDYYQDIYDYQQSAADEQLELIKDSMQEQVDTVSDGLNDILNNYKNAYNDIRSNIEGYKQKLLSVGEVFSVLEEDGKKVLQVNDMRDQMKQMEAYAGYIKKLKEQKASEGLLSELTSMDFEDGSDFAYNLVKMSDSEFEEINELYKRRDELAQYLAEELYQPEIDSLNTNLKNDIAAKFGELPEAVREAGVESVKAFMEGLNSGNISEQVGGFVSDFFTALNEGIDSMELDFNTLYEQDTYSVGLSLGSDFVSGFNAALEELETAVRSEQALISSEYTIKNSGSTDTQQTTASASGKNTERIVIENHLHAELDVDGEKMAEKVVSYTETINARRGK